MDNNLDDNLEEIEKNLYIKLPNDIYDDLSVTNEALTILILMYRNYMRYKNLGICSIDMITKIMRVDSSNNKKIVSTIKDAILALIDKGYIIELYDLDYDKLSIDKIKKNTIFYAKLLPPVESNYFRIYDKDINYIFKKLETKKLSKFNLIRYFVVCKRIINNESSFGFLSQKKLNSLINDSKTISRYNYILQDVLELIRYDNSYLTPDKHYHTTFIGKYDEEVNFNQQVEWAVQWKNLIKTDKTKSNAKRSNKQKINNNENKIKNTSDINELKRLKKENEQLRKENKKLQYNNYEEE